MIITFILIITINSSYNNRQIFAGLAIYVHHFFVKAYIKERKDSKALFTHAKNLKQIFDDRVLYVISYVLTFKHCMNNFDSYFICPEVNFNWQFFFYILYVFSNFSQDLKFWFSEFMPDRNC